VRKTAQEVVKQSTEYSEVRSDRRKHTCVYSIFCGSFRSCAVIHPCTSQILQDLRKKVTVQEQRIVELYTHITEDQQKVQAMRTQLTARVTELAASRESLAKQNAELQVR